MGLVLLFASNLIYERHAQSEIARLRIAGWQGFVEPDYFEEGALWASLFSIALGCGLLLRDLSKTIRKASQ
jgi:hypothetical protein